MRSADAETMRRIDEAAQQVFGIPEILLMEGAGRETAQAILRVLPKGKKGTIAFFCGKGNNGGDGFAAARYLFLEEIPVVVFFIGRRESLKDSAKVNFEILSRLRCPIEEADSAEAFKALSAQKGPFVLAVDALLGTGLQGEVRDPLRGVIDAVNQVACPVLSVDIPSGLCATTGHVLGCCVKASYTVTFGLPKTGFSRGEGPRMTGRVIVRNIGYPKSLLA